MFVLIRLYAAKRIRFLIGIAVGLLLLNIFFTGIYEFNDPSSDLYEGLYVANILSLAVIFILHVLSVKNDFYSSRKRLFFSFPIQGYAVVVSRLVFLTLDVAFTVLVNLLFSFLVRLVLSRDIKVSSGFLSSTFPEILGNSGIIVFSLLVAISVIYFAVALSNTLFYQNRVYGLLFASTASAVIVFLIYGLSGVLNKILPAKMFFLNTASSDMTFFIPIIENNHYDVLNIFLLAVIFLFCVAATARIIDRHLNL